MMIQSIRVDHKRAMPRTRDDRSFKNFYVFLILSNTYKYIE